MNCYSMLVTTTKKYIFNQKSFVLVLNSHLNIEAKWNKYIDWKEFLITANMLFQGLCQDSPPMINSNIKK